MDDKTLQRFWDKVQVSGPDDCWEWKGAVSGDGYGSFGLYKHKKVGAHRFSHEIHRGDLGDLWALHTCDNKRCCNPSHLYAGTREDNTKDAVDRKRLWSWGQNSILNHNAKLTIPQVRKIRELCSLGMKNTEIARQFGVTHQMISSIRRGKSWTDPGI